MSSLTISLIAALCIFCGSLLGLFLRNLLPSHHLSNHSKEAIKIGAGLIATLTALVLGLLVSSAKSSFDTMNDEIKQGSATLILLDHALVKYGPKASPARKLLQDNLSHTLNKIWPPDDTKKTNLQEFENSPGIEAVRDKIETLHPQTDQQRSQQAEALQLCAELAHSRWLLIEQAQNSLPMPFLVILVFWLTIFFVSFGLLAPHNGTIIAVMLVCSLSVAGALFFILEMNHPLVGMIKVSRAPLEKALEHMSKTSQ